MADYYVDNANGDNTYSGDAEAVTGFDGLVAHFKLNENAASTTVVDFSQSGLVGTASQNTSIFSMAGKINTAFDYDAVGENVQCAANSLVDNLGASDFSACAWIAPNSDGSGCTTGRIVTKRDAAPGADGGWLFYVTTNGVLSAMGVDGDALECHSLSNNAALTFDGSWQWVYMEYDQSTKTFDLYVNNSEVGYATQTAGTTDITDDSGGVLIIGNTRAGDNNRGFDGGIDDVRVYNRKLTSGERGQIYNSTSGTEDGLNGGPWQTIQKAADTCVAGDTCYIQSGTTYTLTATCDFDTNAGSDGNPISFIGYTTTITDDGQPTITKAGGVNYLFNLTKSHHGFDNFIFDDGDQSNFYSSNAVYGIGLYNCKSINSTHHGFFTQSNHTSFVNCEAHSNGYAGFCADNGNRYGWVAIGCYSHDNTQEGFKLKEYNLTIQGCLIESNGFDGILLQQHAYGVVLINNTIDDNGYSGIHLIATNSRLCDIYYNIITNHDTAGYFGIDADGNEGDAFRSDYNAYWNNDNDVSGMTKGANAVALTSQPYTTAGSDWSLNNTSGGGEDCRQVEVPCGLLNSAVGTSYIDLGALQAEASGGTSGGSYAYTG